MSIMFKGDENTKQNCLLHLFICTFEHWYVHMQSNAVYFSVLELFLAIFGFFQYSLGIKPI